MRDYKLYVEDVLEAIGRIEEYTEGLSLEEFRASKIVIDAVVRTSK